jgi:hypothetical protein
VTEQAEHATRERLGHPLTRMSGRDPAEPHRASTPLDLLFYLAFVVAFGQAADQLARLLGEGRGDRRPRSVRVRDVRRLLGVDQFLVVRIRI